MPRDSDDPRERSGVRSRIRRRRHEGSDRRTPGYVKYVCEKCGDKYTESIPAKGYSFDTDEDTHGHALLPAPADDAPASPAPASPPPASPPPASPTPASPAPASPAPTDAASAEVKDAEIKNAEIKNAEVKNSEVKNANAKTGASQTTGKAAQTGDPLTAYIAAALISALVLTGCAVDLHRRRKSEKEE